MKTITITPTIIPEAESGDWHIQHQEVRGETYTKLYKGDTLIMIDHPAEKITHEIAKTFYGKVLIGGLGLGYVASILPDEVTHVDIVDNSQDVIDLVWKHLDLDDRYKLHKDDIFNWKPDEYDFVYLDVWDLPNRAGYDMMIKLKPIFPDAICWKEKEMLCQYKEQ
jgi:spermidine synthase